VGSSETLTATYTPDTAGASTYKSATGTHTVAVTAAPTYVLTVNSTNPSSGVAIGVIPNDKNGASSGSTSFTRTYFGGTAVTLTAPAMSGTNIFSSWSGCATTATVTCNVTLNANTTVNAIYTVYTGPTITTSPTLPNGFVGTPYSGTITLTGGTGPYAWTVNGTAFTSSGGSVNLPDGLNASSSGGSILYIGGQPATADTVPYTVSFSASATDTSTGITSPAVQFTITVYSQGFTVGGNINLTGCGGNVPQITVSINTNPVQTTTTYNNGQFQFYNSIPAGTYTVTPSIAGPSSVFYPATQSVLVNSDNSSPSVNFQAALGYTVTGTVAYTGTQTGRIYVQMSGNNCGGGTPGTSIAAPGAFTIRGVPPGSYTVQAWMDNLGYGAQNASNPAGSISSVTIPKVVNPSVALPNASKAGANAIALGQTLTLVNPGSISLSSSAPGIQGAFSFNTGVVLFFQPIVNNNTGVEMATSYTVEWSTTATFPTSVPASQTKTFPAVGTNGTGIWIVNGLVDGTPYYFRVQGVAGNSTSNWYTLSSPVTSGAPTGGNTVTGTVSFTVPSTGTAAGKATGPLYTGFYDNNTNSVYVEMLGSKTNPPVSGVQYTVRVPTGSSYVHFGILDQLNLGVVVPGDISDTNGNNTTVSVSPTQAAYNLTLPSANSAVTLRTENSEQINQYNGMNGPTPNYSLNFGVSTGIKLPVAVALTSATNPNVIVPTDIGECSSCGGNSSYGFSVNLGSVPPNVGDSYGFQVTYSDGTTANLAAPVTGVLTSLPSDLLPQGACMQGCNLQPTFSWSDGSLPSSYTYGFQLMDSNYNTIWEIPGKHSNSNGFPSSITSLQWGVDPTNSSNKPSLSTLASGTEYYWQVQASDANGNSAQTQVEYYPGYTPLALPATNPGTLPAAAAGQYYTGSIAATGGYPCYSYYVQGLSDNLNWTTNGNCGSPLIINGTPDSTGTVSFQVTVYDNNGSGYGPVTYTINVLPALPVSLPTSTPSSLGPALLGYSYSGAINASNGVSPYIWTVNGAQYSANNTAYAIPSGNGLTATSSGGNTLVIGGTPTVGPITLTVEVTDGNNTSSTETYIISTSSGPNGANNGNLKGQYTCLTQGFNDNDGTRWASLSSFNANGADVNGQGTLTGVYDENGSDQSTANTGTVTGTYSIGADNNGLLTVTSTPGNTTQWAIALTDAVEPAQQFRMAEVDTIGLHGTANCYLATTAAFAASTIGSNSFSFGMDGESSNNSSSSVDSVNSITPKAAAGRFTAAAGTSGGNITGGFIDMAKGGCTTTKEDTFTGTYTAPDANGRFALTIIPATQTSANCPSNTSSDARQRTSLSPKPASNNGSNPVMTVYIIDANRAFMLETDAGSGLTAGNVRKQQQATYSGSIANGPFAIYMQGVEYDNGTGNGPTGAYSQVMQGTGTSAGDISINSCYKDDNSTYNSDCAKSNTQIPLTFDSSHVGRVTLTPGNGTAYLYLFGTTTAGNTFTGFNGFELSVDGQGGFDAGWVEPQTQTVFNPTAVAGTYMLGKAPPPTPTSNDAVGEFTLASNGNITGGISTSGEGDFSFDQSSPMTFVFDTTVTGTGSLLVGSGAKGASCVVITPSKIVCTLNGDDTPDLLILQK
jgi:hypothetical protein